MSERPLSPDSKETGYNTAENASSNASQIDEHAQFQQQLIQLRHQQHVQQQMLLQHFQAQQRQLTEQHERQLQLRVKQFLEEQKKLDEEHKQEKERKEKERLEQLKNKDKHEYSAVASTEVKQSLHEFLLNKKHREATGTASSPKNFKHWSKQHSSLDQASPPLAMSPQCRNPLLGKYDDDFPLRKTASEPNLKVRSVLKQKVLDRRSSPLLKSKERGQIVPKRRPPPMDGISNRSESDKGSPQTSFSRTSSYSSTSNGSTPIHEEVVSSPFMPASSTSDLSLYSSPSLPDISLGRPNAPMNIESRSLNDMKFPMPTSASLGTHGNSQVLHSIVPLYPTLPVLETDSQSLNMDYIHELVNEQGISALLPSSSGSADMQLPQSHQQRLNQRPLGRTQSAPLPLGHPMLQHPGIAGSVTERLSGDQLTNNQHKQHCRQTVLTRLTTKSQVDVTEESMQDAPQQFKGISCYLEALPEVDLLDGKNKDGECELTKQQKDREVFLQQQRDIMGQQVGNYVINYGIAHPLSRTLSSPIVDSVGHWQDPKLLLHSATGLAYDSLMLRHQCVCGDNTNHPEHSGRLQAIWARLQKTGLAWRCERVHARKATLEELQSCHSKTYTQLFGTNPLNRQKLDSAKLAELPIKTFVMLPCGGIGVDSDTVWNELHTASSAKMAAGCVLDLAFKVATGELRNGFALVRPPGHHAEYQQPMGFCYFNSLGIAARLLRRRLKMEKILIIDWDVHHGNGLQQLFYDDPHVLYISIHRHDDGNFFPGTGDPEETGADEGVGFNVNIAWNGSLNPPMGDAEYLAAFRCIALPIAVEFNPDITLVACGFDAAKGHAAPLGGYNVTPACFAHITKQLMEIGKGKVVMALEGGYDLPSICDCAEEVIIALLDDACAKMSAEEVSRKPCQIAQQSMRRIAGIQAKHWPSILHWVPTINMSMIEVQQTEREVDTVTALASLSMAATYAHFSPDDPIRREEPMEEDHKK